MERSISVEADPDCDRSPVPAEEPEVYAVELQ